MEILNKSCAGLALCSLILLAGCVNSRRIVKQKKIEKVKYPPNGPKRYKNRPLSIAVKSALVGGSVLVGSYLGGWAAIVGTSIFSPHGVCPCCLMIPAIYGGTAGALVGSVVGVKNCNSWANKIIGRDNLANTETVQADQIEKNRGFYEIFK